MRDDGEDGDKGKDRDQNGDRDKGTRVSSPSIFGIRKRSTMKPSLRLKLKDQVGLAIHDNIIILIFTAHACSYYFFFHSCMYSACPQSCSSASDCCAENPTCACRSECR